MPSLVGSDVFVGSEAVAAGLVTRAQLRSPRYRRLLRGVYVDASTPVDHELRCRAALLVAPDSVVTGRSAAWLWGARTAVTTWGPVSTGRPPEASSRSRRGVSSRRPVLETSDVTFCRAIPVTTTVRTAWDIGGTESVEDAVPVLDEMLHRGVVTSDAVTRYAAGRPGAPGVARVRRALALADAGAESPPESRVRLALTLAGLRPRTQVEVRDGYGRFVARVDMGFVEERVAVEYDGGWHAEPGQLSRDRARLNALQAAGWTVVFVTAPDLRDLPAVVDRVRRALRHPP
jgi:very-short-patch-repair endonuclease